MAQPSAQGRRDRNQSSQTVKAIIGVRELVYSGQVPPGGRLSEVAISEELALSRTPVRAALARLEQEGVLEQIPSGGYAVRGFSAAEVADAIELRGVLEGTAARLAAERGVAPARLAMLQSVLGELDEAVGPTPDTLDFERYFEKNAAFHELLAELCGSTIVRREIERAVQLPFASPSAFLKVQVGIPAFRASLAIGQAQHRAIADAIALREGARAEALAREHARLAKQNLDYVMADRELMRKVPGLSLVQA